jgi:3-dehydro-L-gulonate 2-dehydrogenase
MTTETVRIPFRQLQETLQRILQKKGFSPERAALSARLFAETTRDGVYSHGVNRFPRFLEYIDKGFVNPDAEPQLVTSMGALERWDGRQGPGNLNAWSCMERCIALARQHGMGGVAIRNTNHWMRGGTYGWQAADAGCIGICFTNTIPNLPPWGGKEPRLGNNPLVIAIPHDGGHVVLDTAMSLYSYGKMEVAQQAGKLLPYDGGFDSAGNLTRDPSQILKTERPLPIGYWKGAGLSLAIDLMAAVLSEGFGTAGIGELGTEYRVSQVFICIDVSSPAHFGLRQSLVQSALDFIHSSAPANEDENIFYPGEKTLRTRQENQTNGVPVELKLWQSLRQLVPD